MELPKLRTFGPPADVPLPDAEALRRHAERERDYDTLRAHLPALGDSALAAVIESTVHYHELVYGRRDGLPVDDRLLPRPQPLPPDQVTILADQLRQGLDNR